jgi:inner membrane transporter RhtA
MRWRTLPGRVPPISMVATAALSVQLGAALATKLFAAVGPQGAVTLRLVFACSVMLPLTLVTRGAKAFPSRDRLGIVVLFGLDLAAMNLTFYEAIARIPLGVAVTVEFSGPLCLSLVASRRRPDVVWAFAAGVGVALLGSGVGPRLDPGGVVFAGLAGVFWAGYILASKKAGRSFSSLDGLSWGLFVAAVVVAPYGFASKGASMLSLRALGLGAAVAALSSVLPYSIDLMTLRRVSPRHFGLMLSLGPALGALTGLVVLGQGLNVREWIALGMVAGANAGSSLSSPRRGASTEAPQVGSELAA